MRWGGHVSSDMVVFDLDRLRRTIRVDVPHFLKREALPHSFACQTDLLLFVIAVCPPSPSLAYIESNFLDVEEAAARSVGVVGFGRVVHARWRGAFCEQQLRMRLYGRRYRRCCAGLAASEHAWVNGQVLGVDPAQKLQGVWEWLVDAGLDACPSIQRSGD